MNKPTKIHTGNVESRTRAAADSMRGIGALEGQRKAINNKIGVLRTGIGSAGLEHGFCPKAVKVIQQLQRMTAEELGRFDMTFVRLRSELKMVIEPRLPEQPELPLTLPTPTFAEAEPIPEPIPEHVQRGVAA